MKRLVLIASQIICDNILKAPLQKNILSFVNVKGFEQIVANATLWLVLVTPHHGKIGDGQSHRLCEWHTDCRRDHRHNTFGAEDEHPDCISRALLSQCERVNRASTHHCAAFLRGPTKIPININRENINSSPLYTNSTLTKCAALVEATGPRVTRAKRCQDEWTQRRTSSAWASTSCL
jgi:hypothetical protein